MGDVKRGPLGCPFLVNTKTNKVWVNFGEEHIHPFVDAARQLRFEARQLPSDGEEAGAPTARGQQNLKVCKLR